ncbi:MAG: DUF4388 domain-containing protein, partial [Myxococcota bacterium]
ADARDRNGDDLELPAPRNPARAEGQSRRGDDPELPEPARVQHPTWPGVGQSNHKVERAMNQAIDDFVRSAIAALPPPRRGRARPTLVAATPPPPVLGQGTDAEASTDSPESDADEAPSEEPETAEGKSAVSTLTGVASPQQLRTPAPIANPAEPVAANPAEPMAANPAEPMAADPAEPMAANPTGAIAAEPTGSEFAAAPPDPVEPLAEMRFPPPPQLTDRPTPEWRQPTVILPGDGAADDSEPQPLDPLADLDSASAAAAAAASDDASASGGANRVADHADDAPAASDPDRPGNPSGNDFARQLRRKMSAMAERLFPGQAAKKPVSSGLIHSHSTEIDLAAFDDEPDLDDSDHGAPDSDLDGLLEATGGLAESEPGSSVARPLAPRPLSTSLPGPAEVSIGHGHGHGHNAAAHLPMASATAPNAGELCRGEADTAILIERMFRRRFTGRIEFRRAATVKEILFEGGRPVFASSTSSDDRMGELLFREGKITTEQHQKVRTLVASSGRRMGEVLIEMGWLKRRELLPVVRRHIENLVYSLFAWDSGRYQVVEGDFAAAERIRISRHPAALILEGVRRKYDIDSLVALVGAAESIIEVIDDRQLKTVVSVADLSAAERKVITGFDGENTLDHVQRISQCELIEVYQLAYGLIAWGAAQTLRRGETGALVASDAASPLVGATDLAIDRQRVLAKYSLVNEADYFTLLGVRRDATSFEIKRAYELARRDYASEGFPPEVRRELSGQIAEINELLDEAYQVLRDDGLRGSYLANLCD